MGLLVVPLAYLTVWELVKSTTAALVAATIVLCGEGNINSFRPSLFDCRRGEKGPGNTAPLN